jgi:hypothetical protein
MRRPTPRLDLCLPSAPSGPRPRPNEHAKGMPHLTWCSPNACDWTMSRAMPYGVGDGPSEHGWATLTR